MAATPPSPPPALPPDPPPVPPDPPPVPPTPSALAPDARLQLPPHRGKLARVQDHFQGTVNGITDWMELRLALVRREIEEAVERKKHEAEVLGKAWGITAVLGLAAAIMSLFFLGFLFSALWGFLIASFLWALALGYLTLVLLLGLGTLVAMRRAKVAGARLHPAKDAS